MVSSSSTGVLSRAKWMPPSSARIDIGSPWTRSKWPQSGSPGRSGLCAYGRMEGGSSRHCASVVARALGHPVPEDLVEEAPGHPERFHGEQEERRLPAPLAHMGHHPRLDGRSARIHRSPLSTLRPLARVCEMVTEYETSVNRGHHRWLVGGVRTKPTV